MFYNLDSNLGKSTAKSVPLTTILQPVLDINIVWFYLFYFEIIIDPQKCSKVVQKILGVLQPVFPNDYLHNYNTISKPIWYNIKRYQHIQYSVRLQFYAKQDTEVFHYHKALPCALPTWSHLHLSPYPSQHSISISLFSTSVVLSF